MAYIGADLSNVSADDMAGGGWRVLPDGDYTMLVTQSDYLKNAKGNGHNLKLWLQTADGKTKWFEFLALDNPSAEAVRIARAKLKQLAIAVGVRNPDRLEDSGELHMKPFLAAVTSEVASQPKYGDVNGMVNRVKAYKPLVAGATQAVAQHQAEEDEAVDAITGGAGEDDFPF